MGDHCIRFLGALVRLIGLRKFSRHPHLSVVVNLLFSVQRYDWPSHTMVTAITLLTFYHRILTTYSGTNILLSYFSRSYNTTSRRQGRRLAIMLQSPFCLKKHFFGLSHQVHPTYTSDPPTYVPAMMKGISTAFLAVVATALVAAAKPSHAAIAALQHRQPGSGLHARSGIDPSSIPSQCQPNCTPILQKLDVCPLFPITLQSLPSEIVDLSRVIMTHQRHGVTFVGL